MLPIMQLNVLDLPFVHAFLHDIRFMTVFSSSLEQESHFLVRTYSFEDEIETLQERIKIKENCPPLKIAFKEEGEDYPFYDDWPPGLVEYLEGHHGEEKIKKSYPCSTDSKVGGWPSKSTIRSRLFEECSFTLQIDTSFSSHLRPGLLSVYRDNFNTRKWAEWSTEFKEAPLLSSPSLISPKTPSSL